MFEIPPILDFVLSIIFIFSLIYYHIRIKSDIKKIREDNKTISTELIQFKNSHTFYTDDPVTYYNYTFYGKFPIYRKITSHELIRLIVKYLKLEVKTVSGNDVFKLYKKTTPKKEKPCQKKK